MQVYKTDLLDTLCLMAGLMCVARQPRLLSVTYQLQKLSQLVLRGRSAENKDCQTSDILWAGEKRTETSGGRYA